MSESNIQLQKLNLSPQQVTKEAVIACFNIELTKRHYQKVLQGILSIKPDKHNLKQSYEQLKAAEKFQKELEDAATAFGRDYYLAHRTITGTTGELIKPISEALASLKRAIKVVDDEVVAEKRKAKAEEERVNTIKHTITAFINNCTTVIPSLSRQGIVNLQKRIGTELSKTTFYGGFIDDLRTQCEALFPLINSRKEVLKSLEGLQKQQEEATKNGDDEKLLELKEQLEAIDDHLEINAIQLQEVAFTSTISNDIVVAEPVGEEAKGRYYWDCEVEDLLLLYKKHPEFVKLVFLKDEAMKLLAEKKKDKAFLELFEYKIPGLRFFRAKRI